MEKANPLDNANLKDHQARLHAHPLYAAVNTIEATRLFMERHCFAVWDFFLLIKDLQRYHQYQKILDSMCRRQCC